MSVPSPRVFNPDDYLRTPEGRAFTIVRNAAAWERLYSDMEAALAAAETNSRLVVVMGVQGAGKSTWIHRNQPEHRPETVFLDAALPARRHRARALALAKRFSVPADAVWIKATLQSALRQNAQRPPDERVPDQALRSVFSLIEPPTEDEGFATVQVVCAADDA